MSTHDAADTNLTSPTVDEEVVELAPDGATAPAEDDVEGHNIGAYNPTLARMLSDAKERDITRQASRSSLLGEAKRRLGKKR